MWHTPELLDRFKCESKLKNNEKDKEFELAP
jgi:hypothetical protein